MELEFEDYELTIAVGNFEVPYSLQDDVLFLTIRATLLELLADPKTTIFHFGLAPDHDADGQEELLANGIFFRVIAYEKNIGVDLESSDLEILKAFHYLVAHYEPKWTTIFEEEIGNTKQTTIEIMYPDVF